MENPKLAVSDGCRCWQTGRCLADCPSADQTAPTVTSWWDRRAGEWIDASEATMRDIRRYEARED